MRGLTKFLSILALFALVASTPVPHGVVEEVDCDAEDMAKRSSELKGPTLALCF
ncbi:hypothetical protein CERSUDRAFT_96882 [Gelatoporia subvermispora B]|uniref:Uncharacterized protein n=1 Tax=Ceriporiopsis subvermispora (strain B) TaxID=914234 RepID=M2R8F6_CERS8|nr:hypothetical protein CERSUDRAFT_96882 [Gelatoporia subvermispora B]